MKKGIFKIFIISVLAGLVVLPPSCTQDLLDQEPTTEVNANLFWKTEADAELALMGAYASVRFVFDRDYYFDGQGEYVRVRSNTLSTVDGNLFRGDAYRAGSGGYDPSGYGDDFDRMYKYLYGGVHRTNYVIENARKMLAKATNSSSVANLERIVGEARLLRGMVYFRLITMWGHVPYINHVIYSNSEVQDLARTDIAVVKDSIMADFTYAFEKLSDPKDPKVKKVIGRPGKQAALAFRGKLQLYWASWNKFGWPELEGFTPDAGGATAAYTAAATDFKSVIEDYGLTLFRNGEPGGIDSLGKADILPNYYYLFTPVANGDPEMIMYFTHGGTGTAQGEELMRDFAGRSHESSQLWVHPRYEIADRYQSTETGDFAPKLIQGSPTEANRTKVNSAVNPQSYKKRDYRMKSSIMWDYEMSIGLANLKSTGYVPFIYDAWNSKVKIDGVEYTSYNTDGCNSGYVFRKFLRNYGGLGRSDGDYAWPVMRLADVYLMYAEATNEINGPQDDAVELVNKVRHRGNLPPLAGEKRADRDAFFAAIEQERIVELLGEGHRAFDIRRWRAIERVWSPPYGNGVWRRDTHGRDRDRYYLNTSERTYQQNYIFRIPPGERDRNPNLTQNTPWL